MTSLDDIRNWLLEGKQKKATHCMVVCDTFDYEDYPVYVKKSENVHEIENKYHRASMQKVMEIYNLKKPIEPQLADRGRCFNY